MTHAQTDESLGHESYQESQAQAAGIEVLPTEPEAPTPPAPDRTAGLELAQPAGMDRLPSFPGYDEMRGMASMAVTLSAAAAVPQAMQNRPNDVFLVLLTGRELGIPPTTALRECHVIDGKVTVSPKLRLALVRSSGAGRVWKDPKSNAQTATWYGVRADDPETVHASTFTMDDAKRVKDRGGKVLADKQNWKSYPQRMLSWRAAGYLLDDVFSEVGTGLYSPDEMGAMTDEDGKVIDVASADPLPGTNAPRNRPKPPVAEPEGFANRAEGEEAHMAVTARIHALPESVDRAPFQRYRQEHGWPMSRQVLDGLAEMVTAAEALVQGGTEDPGRPFEPAEAPTAAQERPETPEAPDTPPTRLERPCQGCGGEEATTALDGVELCAECEQAELDYQAGTRK